MADELDLLDVIAAELMAAFELIEASDWESPTPCDDWLLHDLVDHVAGGNWYTTGVLAGATSDAALEAAFARFADDSATAEAAIESTQSMHAAFHRPGSLRSAWHHVAGNLSGEMILRVRLHDLIIHSWDLRQTLTPPATVSASTAVWGLTELARDDSLMGFFDIATGASRPPIGPDPARHYLSEFGRRLG